MINFFFDDEKRKINFPKFEYFSRKLGFDEKKFFEKYPKKK